MNWKRLIKWPWFVKAEKHIVCEGNTLTRWESDVWFDYTDCDRPVFVPGWVPVAERARWADLTRRIAVVREAYLKAKAQKKRNSHYSAELEELQTERLRIEGGE